MYAARLYKTFPIQQNPLNYCPSSRYSQNYCRGSKIFAISKIFGLQICGHPAGSLFPGDAPGPDVQLQAQQQVCSVSCHHYRHASCHHVARSHLTLYFVLSVSTLLLYWAWFVYLKYAMGESEASKEVNI